MDWDERIGRRLTLHDLGILQTTIEAGSMSKAASLLRVSQPAISKTIALIERELGVPLVNRSSRGVEPTQYGVALLARSSSAFAELKNGLDRIYNLSDPKSGELCLAADEVALFGIVATVINRIHAVSPRISFNVVPAYTPAEQIEALEEGNVELVVGRASLPFSAGRLDAVELVREKFVVAAGPRSAWAQRKNVKLSDLLDEPWIFPPPDSVSGKAMAEIFRASGLALPRIAIVASSIQLQRRLVMESDFITMFSSSAIRAASKLAVLRVTLSGDSQSVGVFTLSHRTPSPLALLFIEHALAAASDEVSARPEMK